MTQNLLPQFPHPHARHNVSFHGVEIAEEEEDSDSCGMTRIMFEIREGPVLCQWYCNTVRTVPLTKTRLGLPRICFCFCSLKIVGLKGLLGRQLLAS